MKYIAPAELLNNKTILITGAGSGIGAAVAKAYAQHGATVVLLDKNIAALEVVYDAIEASGAPTPALYPLDLQGASIPDYDALVSSIKDNFSKLDGLVHCAASLGQIAPVQHQDPKVWLETLHINLTAPYLLTRASLALMKEQEFSSIIFTTDHHKESAYWAAYGISKAAIEALSKQLADELESEGRVRVNTIDPGTVQTKLHARAFPAVDPSLYPEPEAIVSTYLYLMDSECQNVHGELISAQ